MEAEKTLRQLTNKKIGGETASRNNSKCYIKQNQKETQSSRKMSFSRKALSLETAYTSSGISENLENLLKIGTSGGIQFSVFPKFYATIACLFSYVNFCYTK